VLHPGRLQQQHNIQILEESTIYPRTAPSCASTTSLYLQSTTWRNISVLVILAPKEKVEDEIWTILLRTCAARSSVHIASRYTLVEKKVVWSLRIEDSGSEF